MSASYRNAGLLCIAATALVVVPAFWRSYFEPLAAGEVLLPWVVHAHGMAMMSWCLLTITQAFLAARGRFRLHRLFGYLSLALYAAILLLTMATVGRSSSGMSELLVTLLKRYDLVMFAVAYAMAFFFRRKPELHSRFMIVALLGALPPAWSRLHHLWFPSFDLLDPGQSAIVLLDSVLIILALVDRRSTGRWILAYPAAAAFAAGVQLLSYSLR